MNELKKAIGCSNLTDVIKYADALSINSIHFSNDDDDDEGTGATPLTFACTQWSARNNSEEKASLKQIIIHLLQLGANIHLADKNGIIPYNIIGREPDLSTNQTHISSTTDQHKQTKQANLQKKLNDLQNLIIIYNLTIEICFQNTTPNSPTINKFIQTVAVQFSKITRNKHDATCIRNQFGPINYSNDKANKQFLHFDRIAAFQHLSESDQDNIIEIIHTHWLLFKDEFNHLAQDIAHIIRSSSNDNVIFDEVAKIDGISNLLNKTDKIKWENIERLQSLVEIYLDCLCLTKMSESNFSYALKALDTNQDPLYLIYSFARIVTILGELARHLSDHIRTSLNYLGVKVLNKLRDYLGHQHHKVFAKLEPELIEYFRSFLVLLPSLQTQLKSVVNYMHTQMHEPDYITVKILDILTNRLHPLHLKLNKDLLKNTQIQSPEKMIIPPNTDLLSNFIMHAVRIDLLKHRREKMVGELSHAEKPVNTVNKTSAKNKDVERITKRIQQLESLGAAISEKDQKALLKAKTTLSELVDNHSETIEIILKPDEIRKEMAEINEELGMLQTYTELFNFYDYLTKPSNAPANKAPSGAKPNKLNIFTRSLELEITRLLTLIENAKEQTDYHFNHAIEYSVSLYLVNPNLLLVL